MDDYTENELIRWQDEIDNEKNRFIDSMIAGKTAEQIDNIILDADFIQHAKHFSRIDKLGPRAHPDNIKTEYFKSVIDGDNDSDLLEQEIKYRDVVSTADNIDFSKLSDDIQEDSEDYDGRDDDFIQSVLSSKNLFQADELVQSDDDNVQSDEDISQELNSILAMNLI